MRAQLPLGIATLRVSLDFKSLRVSFLLFIFFVWTFGVPICGHCIVNVTSERGGQGPSAIGELRTVNLPHSHYAINSQLVSHTITGGR